MECKCFGNRRVCLVLSVSLLRIVPCGGKQPHPSTSWGTRVTGLAPPGPCASAANILVAALCVGVSFGVCSVLPSVPISEHPIRRILFDYSLISFFFSQMTERDTDILKTECEGAIE